jgi:hypothetical protein
MKPAHQTAAVAAVGHEQSRRSWTPEHAFAAQDAEKSQRPAPEVSESQNQFLEIPGGFLARGTEVHDRPMGTRMTFSRFRAWLSANESSFLIVIPGLYRRSGDAVKS